MKTWMIIYIINKIETKRTSEPSNWLPTVLPHVFFILLFGILSGCNQWPEASERKLSLAEQKNKLHENSGIEYVNSLLSIAEARFELLVLNGARYCLPGQIMNINKYIQIAKREIDANLLLDAQKNIARAIEHLNFTSDILISITTSSNCISEYKNSKEYDDYDTNIDFKLSNILNCNCKQLSDSGKFTDTFLDRIKFMQSLLIKYPEIKLTIYSSNTDRSNELESIFKRGISKDQYKLKHSIESTKTVSSDGFYFELNFLTNRQQTKVKDWKKSIRIKSAINRGFSE